MPLPEAKTFLLYCGSMVGDGVATYRITVDGKQIIAQMYEGGSVFVEGKHVEILQTSEHAAVNCLWYLVQESPVESISLQWSSYIGNQQALLAAFNQEQDFVIGMNRNSHGCTNPSINLIVDGAVVTGRSSTPLTLLEGSSIIGRGKIVAVVADGICSPTNESAVTGTLKIRKTKI